MNRKKIISGGMVLLVLGMGSFAWAQLLPEDPAKGARLFAGKGCVKCHSLKDEGGKSGPDLGKIDLGDTQLDLATRLLNHAPSMIQGMQRVRIIRPTLTGEELSEMAAHLYLLKFFDEQGNSTRGKYIFSEKTCNACHPLTGRGREGALGLNQFPQNISPIFLSQAIWNHGPDMIAQMKNLGIPWPEFKGTETMDLLEYIRTNARGPKEVAYLTPGNPRQGRQVFIAKGCVKCHAVRGEGGKEGEDLGVKGKMFYQSLTQVASSMWNKGPTVLAKMAATQSGIPKFTPGEMADLLTYLYFLHFTDDVGNATRGKKSFSDMGCVKCHGVEGKPGEVMQIELSKYQKAGPMDFAAGLWNHGGEIEKAMKDQGMRWPRFRKGELADIFEYVHASK
jgi:cytochrome c2